MKIRFLGSKNKLWLEYIKEYPVPIANYKIYYDSKKFGKVKKWEYIFHCEVKDDTNFKVQQKEIQQYKWFSPEEVYELENIFAQIPLLLKKVL